MTWISASVLAASASYLLYRYQFSTWRSKRTDIDRDGTAVALLATEESNNVAASMLFRDEKPKKIGDIRSEQSRKLDFRYSPPSSPKSGQVKPLALTLPVPTFHFNDHEEFGECADSPTTPKAQNTTKAVFDAPSSPNGHVKPPETGTTSTSSPPRSNNVPITSDSAFGNRAMPPPPRPSPNTPLRPPPSAAASLRAPRSKALTNSSLAPTSSILAPNLNKPSRKVILSPGHSPLDWATLTSNPNAQLRGKDVPSNLIRISPSMLKYQNGRKGRDAWTVWQGKVYNITPYLPFHPGGAGEILRGAGRDSAKLFMEVHPWVNWDGMLGECLVGILVGDGEEKGDDTSAGGLDEMD